MGNRALSLNGPKSPKSPKLCPICHEGVGPRQSPGGSGGASENTAFPFCSDRCQLVDLSHWLDGDYRMPEDPADGMSAVFGATVSDGAEVASVADGSDRALDPAD